MKKHLCALAVLLASAGAVRADETNPKIWFSLGSLQVNVPFKTINGVGLWDFVAKQSLAGAETPLVTWKRLEVVGGAVTSLDGAGTPFLGVHVVIPNPAENFVALSSFRPGVFAGRNFRNNDWVLGLKASVGLF